MSTVRRKRKKNGARDEAAWSSLNPNRRRNPGVSWWALVGGALAAIELVRYIQFRQEAAAFAAKYPSSGQPSFVWLPLPFSIGYTG
jgi:hypothetical protein